MSGKCQVVGSPKNILIGMFGYKSYDLALADLDKNFQKLEITINGVKSLVRPSEYFVLLE